MNKSVRVAVVGAMGAVGREMMRVLEHSSMELERVKPLDVASEVGKEVSCRGTMWKVEEARKGSFSDVDIALFSAGAGASEILAPIAVEEGAVVVDNSSQWRMTDWVPLVIPEVNPEALRAHKGLIANPNCSTIQMLVVLKPLHERFKIRRVVVSTYQAVSGSGAPAIEELTRQAADFVAGEPLHHSFYPHQIAFNALPHIDVFLDNGYTKEEMKMVHETHKMLDPAITVSPTAVRIPVFRGHSESLNIEFVNPYRLDEVFSLLREAPGIEVVDEPAEQRYPMAIEAEGKDAVFVGRIRRDVSMENALNLWIVSDNLRKGAALNAVQIAEKLVEMNLLSR